MMEGPRIYQTFNKLNTSICFTNRDVTCIEKTVLSSVWVGDAYKSLNMHAYSRNKKWFVSNSSAPDWSHFWSSLLAVRDALVLHQGILCAGGSKRYNFEFWWSATLCWVKHLIWHSTSLESSQSFGVFETAHICSRSHCHSLCSSTQLLLHCHAGALNIRKHLRRFSGSITTCVDPNQKDVITRCKPISTDNQGPRSCVPWFLWMNRQPQDKTAVPATNISRSNWPSHWAFLGISHGMDLILTLMQLVFSCVLKPI